MSSKPQIATEIEELKQDASRVLADIVKISSHIRDTGGEPSTEQIGIISDQLKEKIESMRGTIKTIQEEISQRVKKADKHVKTNPYLFLALAGGDRIRLGKAPGSSEGILKAALKVFDEFNTPEQTNDEIKSIGKPYVNFVIKFKVAEALAVSASLLFGYTIVSILRNWTSDTVAGIGATTLFLAIIIWVRPKLPLRKV